MTDRIGKEATAAELVARMGMLGVKLDEATIERMDAAARAEQLATEERERRAAMEARVLQLASWGMPTKDLEAISVMTLESSDAKTAVDRFVQRHSDLRKQHVLVLRGDPGSGKTCAAAYWLALRGAKHPHVKTLDPLFLTASRIARTSSYDDAALTRIELAEKLVVDDLGAEYHDEKGSFASKLDAIMDARYEHLLPTIITTNLSHDDFKKRMGPRIGSRFEETAHVATVRGEFRKRP